MSQQKSQDFFQDNNAIKVKYTTTRIKSKNFLSNIAYVGINKEDYYNRNFIFDVYLLITILAAQKISNKYKNIRSKRKRKASPEPTQIVTKKPRRSKALTITAKQIKDKYKRLHYG